MHLIAANQGESGDVSFPRDHPVEQIFAIRADGRLTALVFWRTEYVLVHGRPTPIALIQPLVMSPHYAGQDVLAPHQAQLLAAIRASGCVLAGLESPITRWHRRNGWGACAATLRTRALPEQLRPVVSVEDGSYEFASSPVEISALYDIASRDRFGFLERPHQKWTQLLDRSDFPGQPSCVVWRSGNGRAEGYVVTRRLAERPGSAQTTLVVSEFVALTPNAYLGLLSFLSEHRDVASVRLALPSDDPIASVLRDPQRVDLTLKIDKLLRVIDLHQLAIPARGLDLAAAEELMLLVDDPQAAWNSGQWRVHAGEGDALWFRQVVQAKHTSPPKRDPWIRLPAIALGPLISGNLTIYAALSCGLITMSDAEALGKLESLFSPSLAPYCPERW